MSQAAFDRRSYNAEWSRLAALGGGKSPLMRAVLAAMEDGRVYDPVQLSKLVGSRGAVTLTIFALQDRGLVRCVDTKYPTYWTLT